MGEQGSKRRNLTAVGLLLIRLVLAVHDAVAGAAEVDAVAVAALKLIHVAGGIQSWAEHGNVSSARLRSASPLPFLSPSHPCSPLQVKSSCRTRSPRHEQLTWPLGVSRHRSWQPPLFTRHGDSSPRTEGQWSHHGWTHQPLLFILPARPKFRESLPRLFPWAMEGVGVYSLSRFYKEMPWEEQGQGKSSLSSAWTGFGDGTVA